MTDNREHNLRILIVEDDPNIRQLLKDLLKTDNHDVSVAADGESALKFLQSDRFDLLITDLGLPGISGWELSVASKRYQKEIRVVAISSWMGQRGEQKKKECGVDTIIWKPFKFDQIRDEIDRFFPYEPAEPTQVNSN
jgi:DNA-binding response OmpR family regulator